MNTSIDRYIGIDVSKASLQIDTNGRPRCIANTPRAIHAWLEQLRGDQDGSGVQLVCEPSGGYEHALVRAAQRCGVAISVVNARHVRAFARAHGLLEKTDVLDARILRAFGEQIHPATRAPAGPALEHLQAWVAQRDHAVESLRRETNRLEQERLPGVRKCIERTCRYFERLIQEADTHLHARLAEDTGDLYTRVQTLCLVEAIHVRTATSLIAYLPELGALSDRAVAKLAGLAPLPDDSGTLHGPRFIQHGRAPVRRALYMAALVAIRHNPALRPFYKRLRERGKPPKLALVAVARKLLVFLNHTLSPATPLIN